MTKLDTVLRQLRWLPIAVIAVATIQTTIWFAEREPPFHVIEGKVIPPSTPGGVLRVDGKVYRDLNRDCYVRIMHWIEDSKGFRHFLPTLGLTNESIQRAERITPGQTKYVHQIAESVATGQANYHAENAYICNPTHLVWPIVVVTDIAFEVTR